MSPALNLRQALVRREFPTITVWNRLEGRPRTRNFDRALAAEVRDALWMISRQWQMGEFRGDDAGSPVLAKMMLDRTRLTRYQAASHPAEPFEDDVPLEAKVERRPVPLAMGARPLSLDVRLLVGRQWLKLIAGPLNVYRQAFLDRYPVERPDPTKKEHADLCAHAEVWQSFAAAAGRLLDGGALLLHLRGGGLAYDGMPAVADGDKPALDDRAARLVAWFDRLFHQPAQTNDAWIPERLEYRFACSAPQGGGQKVFVAEEYFHGRLDWHNVDIGEEIGDVPDAPPFEPEPPLVQTTFPTPVVFQGMPNTRWWEFEERKTNFGKIDAATSELAKLLFIEFGLVYANDWFAIPNTVRAGTIAKVRGLAVTNVFGERTWILPAGRGPDDAWQRWSMFTVNIKGQSEDQAADTSLLLLPTVPKIQESAPLEEVVILRDEMANMVWAVERTVPLANGGTRRGSEAAAEVHAYLQRLLGVTPPPPVPFKAPIVYKVMTAVPEHWIPFIAAHVEGSNRSTRLQRAAMPRILEGDPNPPEKIRPRTVLMREGLDSGTPYYINEEEVPRAGIRVTQAYQRTRWENGRVFLWLGVRKQTGRGEGSSGLAFDQIVAAPPK